MKTEAESAALASGSDSLVPPLGARITLDEIPGRDFTHYETGVSPVAGCGGGYAQAVHQACLRKTADNLGVAFSPDLDLICAACVYRTRMAGIYLYPDGRCNMCHAFEEGLNSPATAGRFAGELKEALNPSISRDKDLDVVVALSGGKDSSAVLSYVALELGLRCIAVLVDNGFIPDYVVENCQAMSDRAGARFVKLGFDFRPEIRAVMAAERLDFVPCNLCSKRFKRLITEFAEDSGCRRVLMGRNSWAAIEPELSGRRGIETRDGSSIDWYSVPFLLRWTLSDHSPRLDAIGWNRGNERIPGNSTNCLVPGMIAGKYEAAVGINPDTQLIADEVIVGFISREYGLKQLAEDG